MNPLDLVNLPSLTLGIGIGLLTAAVSAVVTLVIRTPRIPDCADPGRTGILPCNRPSGHDGDHWYLDHGTGNGDDRFERWPNTERA